MTKQTVRDIDLAGKQVLVRVDYNVPVKDGVVGDTLRIEASFPTIKYLLDKNCRIVLMSHLGEPKGAPEAQYSLSPVAAKAAELLGHSITFVSDCIGPVAEGFVKAMKPGEIILLENVRFHQEELDNDPAFAQALAAWGEVFVLDAFATAHRKQASVVGVASYLPAVGGLLVEHEVDTITQAMEAPKRPLSVIVGGAKISSKIDIVNVMLERADAVLVGGAMANTFLAAQGYPVGRSLYEPDQLEVARGIMAKASERGVKLLLPTDVVVSTSVEAAENVHTVKVNEVAAGDIIVDVGAETIAQLEPTLAEKGTVIWNGPVGITEVKEFAEGSRELAEAIISSGSTSLIGGGDTAAFVDAAKLHDKFSFVSTGGGASLELMSGKPLPGVEALRDK